MIILWSSTLVLKVWLTLLTRACVLSSMVVIIDCIWNQSWKPNLLAQKETMHTYTCHNLLYSLCIHTINYSTAHVYIPYTTLQPMYTYHKLLYSVCIHTINYSKAYACKSYTNLQLTYAYHMLLYSLCIHTIHYSKAYVCISYTTLQLTYAYHILLYSLRMQTI